jgi:pimeloyl-ACP methyl ester carboxylesterase
MKQIEFLGKNLNYKVQGSSEKVVFLLHGYLESLEIWDGFADQLAEDYKVIRMDIPGHGNSDVLGDEHDMDLLAYAAKHVLDEEEVKSCTMIGHSLGGYVTLAFLANYPEKVDAFSLFHSHPFADSQQVKENRQREINLVEQGREKVIINTNIPKAFANDNLEQFKDEVEWARQIAVNTPGKGIIANLKAMMNRPDRSELVKNTDKPFLLIAGLKDNYISYEQVIPRIHLPEKGVLVTLENSGHIGFVEEKENALHVVRDFIMKF